MTDVGLLCKCAVKTTYLAIAGFQRLERTLSEGAGFILRSLVLASSGRHQIPVDHVVMPARSEWLQLALANIS